LLARFIQFLFFFRVGPVAFFFLERCSPYPFLSCWGACPPPSPWAPGTTLGTWIKALFRAQFHSIDLAYFCPAVQYLITTLKCRWFLRNSLSQVPSFRPGPTTHTKLVFDLRLRVSSVRCDSTSPRFNSAAVLNLLTAVFFFKFRFFFGSCLEHQVLDVYLTSQAVVRSPFSFLLSFYFLEVWSPLTPRTFVVTSPPRGFPSAPFFFFF